MSVVDPKLACVEGCARLDWQTNVEKSTMAVGAEPGSSTERLATDVVNSANEAAASVQPVSVDAPPTGKRFFVDRDAERHV